MVSIVDSGRTEHSHWPIPMVWTGTECYKFQIHDMPTGHTRSEMSEEVEVLWCTVMGAAYQKRLRIRVSCPYCGLELTAGSMMSHICHMHGSEP